MDRLEHGRTARLEPVRMDQLGHVRMDRLEHGRTARLDPVHMNELVRTGRLEHVRMGGMKPVRTGWMGATHMGGMEPARTGWMGAAARTGSTARCRRRRPDGRLCPPGRIATRRRYLCTLGTPGRRRRAHALIVHCR